MSVQRAVRQELPAEDLLYVADSAHAPYGERSRAFIEVRAIALTEFLLQQDVKAVVVACNTATGAAAETLRSRFTIPIVAMEPAVKPAAARTRSGTVGVLATAHTLSSSRFLKLVDTHAASIQVLIQPCAGFVEQVEKGELASPETRALVERYVRPLVEKGADTLVLGCTHYPFLSDLIREVAGPDVALIDPALAVGRELRRRLSVQNLLHDEGHRGTEQFWTTGVPSAVEAVIRDLRGEQVIVQSLPSSKGRGPSSS